jgi:cobalt-zinc-cadmium efflux system protein
LLADAGHNLADVAGLAIAVIAVRYSLRAPTMARSYGHHRATILAALANGALLLTVTGYIAVQAVIRLFHPAHVRGSTVLVVALVAAVLNSVAAMLVHEKTTRRPRDLNMSAAVVHLAADAVVSLAVAVAGLVIMLSPKATWVDPAVSLLVCVAITVQAVRLVHRSVDVLLESTPRGVDPERVLAAIGEVPTVVDVHDLHVWSLSSEIYAMSAHVALSGHPTLEQAQSAADFIKREVAARFAIGHATLEMECEACPEPDPCAFDVTHAAGALHPHPHVR